MSEPKRNAPRPHGPGRGMMPTEKAKDFKGTMGKLISYLGKYLPAIIAVMLFAIASTVFSIIGPKILGNATTELFNGLVAKVQGTGGIDFEAVARILLFLGIIYLVSAVLSYIQGFIMTKVSTQISYGMRRDISQKINRMPLAYFDRVPNGEVLSRITNDVDTVTQTLNQSMTQIVTSVTQFIGVLVMMLTISPLMTLVALCILPLSLIIVSNVVKRSQPFFQKQQAYLGHANGHVEEMYGGHLVVTAFNGEEKSIKTFNEINDNLYNSAWKSQFLSGMMMPLMTMTKCCSASGRPRWHSRRITLLSGCQSGFSDCATALTADASGLFAAHHGPKNEPHFPCSIISIRFDVVCIKKFFSRIPSL